MRTPAFAASVLLLIALAACSTSSNGSAQIGAPSPQASSLASLDAEIARRVASGKYPGAVYAVAKGDAILRVSAVGVSDFETGAPMRVNTIFRLMSMTKPVTAVAAMILVDEGKIALDDPVSRYLPEFIGFGAARPDEPSAVTIRQLLTHTSGIGFGSIAQPGETLSERVKKIAAKPLPTPAGTRWQYSGYDGLDVVARLIEVVSREPYDRFLKRRIFRPLQMNDTTYALTPEQEGRLVGLYAARDGKITKSPPPLPQITHTSGGAGLYSTAPDYIRFAEMLAKGGKLGRVRILSRASAAELSRIQVRAGFPDLQPGLAFGLGMRIVADPVALKSPLPAGSYGWSGAWGTHFWVDPSRDVAVVWMINMTTAGGAGSPDALEFEQLVTRACSGDQRCNRPSR